MRYIMQGNANGVEEMTIYMNLIEIEGWNASAEGWFKPCPYDVGSDEARAWIMGYVYCVRSRLECGIDAVMLPHDQRVD